MQTNSQTPHFQSMHPSSAVNENIPEIHFDCNDGQAMQLVRIVNGRTFEIVPETLEYLTKEIEGGVAICSIVGKYRTGKSFLLNRLLDLNENNGFNVSASINACTKGLWLWSKPIFIQKDNLNIIFMDTEGLDSVDRNSDTDARLFALTVLLSSYFIYNSIGAIDEVSINTLSLITFLIKTVALEENKKLVSEYQLAQYAPKLLWILRDFVLEIKDTQNRSVTAQQYLESALVDVNQNAKSGNKDSQKSCQVRQGLINFFKNRDCLTMVRPVNDESELRNIQHLQDDQIRPDFLASLHAVRNKIYKNCTQKVINGVGLNSGMLVAYLKTFIDSFNSGKLPVIQTAWKSLIENECRTHFDKAIQYYESEVKNILDNNVLQEYSGSMKKVELFKSLGYFRDLTLNYFNKCFYIRERDPELFDKYKLRLKEMINDSEKRVVAANLTTSRSKNSDLLNNKFNEFIKLTQPDKLSEEQLADELSSNVLEVYDNQNFGGEETADFAANFQNFSKKVLEWYSASVRQDASRKKNSMVRNQGNEAEKLRIESEQLKVQSAKFTELNRDLEKIDAKISELQNGASTDRISRLKEEKSKLTVKVEMLAEMEKKNSGELAALGLEVEKLTKKKKGC